MAVVEANGSQWQSVAELPSDPVLDGGEMSSLSSSAMVNIVVKLSVTQTCALRGVRLGVRLLGRPFSLLTLSQPPNPSVQVAVALRRCNTINVIPFC